VEVCPLVYLLHVLTMHCQGPDYHLPQLLQLPRHQRKEMRFCGRFPLQCSAWGVYFL
jgi:hypothetical protein